MKRVRFRLKAFVRPSRTLFYLATPVPKFIIFESPQNQTFIKTFDQRKIRFGQIERVILTERFNLKESARFV
jgi:hypothetical protein